MPVSSFHPPMHTRIRTHQSDVAGAHDGAELAQVLHQPIEDFGDALPLVAARFLNVRKLRLQRHQVSLREGVGDSECEIQIKTRIKQIHFIAILIITYLLKLLLLLIFIIIFQKSICYCFSIIVSLLMVMK